MATNPNLNNEQELLKKTKGWSIGRTTIQIQETRPSKGIKIF